MPIPDITEQQAKQLIERRHPTYKRNLDAWKYMRESWRGGDEYEKSNKLWAFNGEKPQEYARRLKLSTYVSYVRAIITDRRNLIFAQPPTYDGPGEIDKADLWKAFNSNFDGSGRKRADVMEEIYCQGSLYGTMFGLVDKGRATGQNLQEQIDRGEHPYVCPYRPQDVLDWSLQGGRFMWVLLRESTRDDADPVKVSSKIVETYLLYHRDYWIRFKATQDVSKYSTRNDTAQGAITVKKVGEGENPIGEVPLVVYRDARDLDDPVIGEVTNYEIAKLSQEIYNLNSNRNEQINQSIVNVLVLTGRGFGKLGEIKLNVSTALKSEDSNAKGEWLKQEVTGIKLISETIDEKRSEILRLSKFRDFLDMKDLQRVSTIPTLVSSSALHKELSQDCNELVKFEQDVDRLFALWEEIDKLETSHKYPKSFNVRSESELINILIKAKAAEMPEKFLEEMKVIAAEVGLPAMSEAVITEIREQAEAMKPYEQQRKPLVSSGIKNSIGLNTNAGNTAALQPPQLAQTTQ